MADIVEKETRSRMMAGIRGKNTKPEVELRRALHARGYRYRLHAKNIPGRPDLALPKYRAVILVHGCFWHRHEGCRFTTSPSTRPEFWRNKFSANVKRDEATRKTLLDAGWRVATVWGCALRRPEQVERAAGLLETWLRSRATALEIGEGNLISNDRSSATHSERNSSSS